MKELACFASKDALRYICGAVLATLAGGCDESVTQRDPPTVSRDFALMGNTNSNGEACILAKELTLNLVQMDAPEAEVINLLGEPQERRPSQPDSDIPVNSLVYPGLTVYLFQDQVAELAATDPFWQTPSGLRVGLTTAELLDVLGQVPIRSDLYPSQLAYEIPPCSDGTRYDLAWSFLVIIDDTGTVTELRFERDWP
jgi:hypothetical protein